MVAGSAGALLRPALALALCSSALLSCAAPPERDAARVLVSVDATAPGQRLEPVWPFFGYDEINYTTLAEGRQLLETLASVNTAPLHVRNHFLFNTGDGTPAPKWGSTNVYVEDERGNPSYDFTLSDQILDALTGAGAEPFVELGFMPEALSSHPVPYRNSDTRLLNGGCFYPPDDYSRWAELIRAWAEHADERYADVARDWPFELWNEPDGGYWHGTFEEYAKLYDYTEAALHEAVPAAQLGGPAVSDPTGDFLRRFLEHCASGTNAVTGATGTRLDLVSFHAKGGTGLSDDHVQMDLGNQLRLHRAGFRSVAEFPQFEQTPIYITEADPDGCAACPAQSVPGSAYRASTAYGAYELAMMKRTLELAAAEGVKLSGILTWAFLFPDTPYFAGYRVLSSNGVDLPVLAAFKLLGQLSGARVPLSSSAARSLEQVLATGVRDQPDIDGLALLEPGTLRILLWSYHDELMADAPTAVRLSVSLPSSFGAEVRLTHLRVDEQHGNAPGVWAAQGKPERPSAEQLAELQAAAADLALARDEIVAVAPGGRVSLDFELPRFGVSLVSYSAP